MDDLIEKLKKTRNAALTLSNVSDEKKESVLKAVADAVAKSKEEIQKANKIDVIAVRKAGKNKAYIDRLTLSDKVFGGMVEQVRDVAKLPDPVGKTLEERTLPNNICIKKISVPIGVIGIIYESRPNVTLDVSSLSFKSGNAVVLKGSTAARNSNRAIVSVIHRVFEEYDIPKEVVLFLDTAGHSVVDELVRADAYVDLIIPRGGYELVKKIQQAASVPVLYHAAGGVRMYIDVSADLEKAVSVCVNDKVSNPAACNSLDTIVVHEEVLGDFLPRLHAALAKYKVEWYGDKQARAVLDMKEATEAVYNTEFLGMSLSVKTVSDVNEAIAFTNEHSKRHSEGIVSEDKNTIQQYVDNIDAAALFVNCSPRFHDGGQFGLGAEMGIATGKLHARGPVGLKELTIHKWIAYGDGQIRE